MVRRSDSSLTHPRLFFALADLTIVDITVVFAPAAHVEYLQTLRVHSDGQCGAAAEEAKIDSSTTCFASLCGSGAFDHLKDANAQRRMLGACCLQA